MAATGMSTNMDQLTDLSNRVPCGALTQIGIGAGLRDDTPSIADL